MKKIYLILVIGILLFSGLAIAEKDKVKVALKKLKIKYIDLTDDEVQKLKDKHKIKFDRSVYTTPCKDLNPSDEEYICESWLYDNDFFGVDEVTGNDTEWPNFARKILIEYRYCSEPIIIQGSFGYSSTHCEDHKWRTMNANEIENAIAAQAEIILNEMAYYEAPEPAPEPEDLTDPFKVMPA